MSKISDAFKAKKAFIAFITGGDPDMKTTGDLIETIADAGADIIEIGIPFSDPIAEGPVIQEADSRALNSGCTVDLLFARIGEIRAKVKVPLLLMTYINPVFVYGSRKFMTRCAEIGIDGIIVPDLPFEEKGELAADCAANGVELISMIAPTSGGRIDKIAGEAEGFIYCVSSLGVTGIRSEIKTDLSSIMKRVKKNTTVPCAVGFGVATPQQAAQIAQVADGVIVGSAIVKIVAEHGRESTDHVRQLVYSMRQAIDKVAAP